MLPLLQAYGHSCKAGLTLPTFTDEEPEAQGV